MAHAGQVLRGHGVVLTLVAIAPERLEMEAAYDGSAVLPPVHLHPAQDEHFEVLSGAVRTVLDGVERRVEAGEAFAVPAGTPHQMAGDGPARVRWVVTPALRTAAFFEGLYGGRAAAEGLTFLDDFREEIRFLT